MYIIKLISKSVKQTEEIGKIIADHIKPKTVIALTGPLAAGKTALAKAIFERAGYGDHFSSPTYTIINEYQNGSKKAYHLDVYRLGDLSELNYTGYDDCIKDGELIIIEWAELIEARLPKDALKIAMDFGEDENTRFITLYPYDEESFLKLKETTDAYSCH